MSRAFLLVLALVLFSLADLTQASASCTVSRNCQCASPVSCSGNICTSGSSGSGWVECDSVRTDCPPVDCSLNGVCNYCCPPLADPDCACASDGYCNPDCGLANDIDCCPQDAFCKYNSQCGPWGVCSNRACICV